jgi:hypothetical protein
VLFLENSHKHPSFQHFEMLSTDKIETFRKVLLKQIAFPLTLQGALQQALQASVILAPFDFLS